MIPPTRPLQRPGSIRTGFACVAFGLAGCSSSEPEELTLPDWLTEPAAASAATSTDAGLIESPPAATATAGVELGVAADSASQFAATSPTAATVPVQPVSLGSSAGSAAAVFETASTLSHKVGDAYRYARTFETVVQQNDASQQDNALLLQSRLTCTFGVDVAAVSGDQIELRLTFERFVLDRVDGTERTTVDTLTGGSGLSALVGQSLRYRVSPQNELLSVDPPGPALRSALASLPPGQRQAVELAFGSDAGVRSLVGPSAGLPLARVQTASSWTTPASETDRHNRRLQTQPAAGGVQLQYAGEIATTAPRSLTGSGVEVAIAAGTVQGEVMIDPATAMPTSARSIETLAMAVTVANEAPFTQQTQTITTLQQLPDAPPTPQATATPSFGATSPPPQSAPPQSVPSAFALPPRATVAPVLQPSTPGVVTPPPYFQRP